MRDYVVHLTPVKNSLIASAKIATLISKTLKIPLLDTGESVVEAVKRYEPIGNLIVVNGPPAFCSFRDELAKAVLECRQWVWVQNDYMIYPPSQVNKSARKRGWVDDRGFIRPPVVWGTIPDKCTTYVNWNCLSARKVLPWGARPQRLCYFGAWRPGRKSTLKKYLPKGVVVSCPSRAAKHFEELGVKSIEPPWTENLVGNLTRFSATLLVQDDRSNRRFMSLPNRFYETLAAGCAQLISEEMVESVQRAGYSVNPRWVVASRRDVEVAIGRSLHIARQQAEAWGDQALMERKKMIGSLHAMYHTLREGQ